MTVFDICLTGASLAMDAVAVSMTNGMTEPRMKLKKTLLIAFFFGAFQMVMPLVGYYGSAAFSQTVARVAPWVSFTLLALIGGKAMADGIRESREFGVGRTVVKKSCLSLGKLTVQAFATSIDALAVGVSFLAQDSVGALPFSVLLCAGVIGIVTFVLSAVAVELGKSVGNALSRRAGITGGFVLVWIGVRLLFEGIM